MLEEILKEFEEKYSWMNSVFYTEDGEQKVEYDRAETWLKEKLTAFEKSVKEEFLKRIKLEIDNLPLYGTLQESGNEWAWKRKDIEFILTNANKEGINIK